MAAVQGFHGAPPPAAPPRRVLEAYEEQAVRTCMDGAFQQINSTDRAGAELLGRLYAASLAALDKDPRVSAATTAWQGCMGAAGFPGVTPQGLVDWYRGRPQAAAEVPPEEIAAATSDAACTTGTNLAGIWFEVLSGYQKQLIDANQQELTEYQKKAEERDAKLARIVAES